MKSKSKPKLEAPVPPFPNEFWETVLRIRRDEPKRFNVFSVGLKRSAEIYEQQRDRALAEQERAA